MTAAPIRSDDPQAIEKLRAKLQGLEELQTNMKRFNAAWRKLGRPELGNTGAWDQLGRLFTAPLVASATRSMTFGFGGGPFPGYALTNNNGNMKRVRERIAALEAEAKRGEAEPVEGNGWTIEEHPDKHRIWLVFDRRLSKDAYRTVRQYGFKWSPTRSAFVRHLNQNGRTNAEWAAKAIEGMGDGAWESAA